MKFRKLSDTAMRCDPWTVSKVWIQGHSTYELWHDKLPAMVGSYSTFEQAKAVALREEQAGQA